MNSSGYDFLSPGRICFGWERIRQIGSIVSQLGQRVILICGSRSLQKNGRLAEIQQALVDSGLELMSTHYIQNEPRTADVDMTVAQIRRNILTGTSTVTPIPSVTSAESSQAKTSSVSSTTRKAKRSGTSKTPNNPAKSDDFAKTVIVAVGGGSAIDLGKAVAAMLVNAQPGQSVLDFLEGVGTGATLTVNPLPVVAVPTTAGTGSESTKNAVISGIVEVDGMRRAFKKSLRHDRMMPAVALVDPQLTVSCSRLVTAASGMDAMTQLFESFISCRSQPIPQALAIQGLGLLWNSLEDAVADPDNQDSREKCSHAALLSGLCLANSGLGLAHGVAAALGMNVNVSHGMACACMLPIALEVNKSACLTELTTLANFLLPPTTSYGWSRVDELIQTVISIQRNLGMPSRLSDLGVKESQIPEIVRDSAGNSLSGNPRPVSEEELTKILLRNM